MTIESIMRTQASHDISGLTCFATLSITLPRVMHSLDFLSPINVRVVMCYVPCSHYYPFSFFLFLHSFQKHRIRKIFPTSRYEEAKRGRSGERRGIQLPDWAYERLLRWTDSAYC